MGEMDVGGTGDSVGVGVTSKRLGGKGGGISPARGAEKWVLIRPSSSRWSS
jgi:hypothetical protein